MKYEEVKQDLFSVDTNKYKPAHCISTDCKMGAGIAVPMRKTFNLSSLNAVVEASDAKHPVTIYHNGVYNLITKARHFHKPTYQTLQSTLNQMKDLALAVGHKHIVMPKIGCGLDGLQWGNVRLMIQNTFEDTDIEILVCYI